MNSKLFVVGLLSLVTGFAVATDAWVGELPEKFASGAAVPSVDVTGPRARFVEGDWARFEHVFARLDRGESVRVVVIGGSITQGAGAGKGGKPWGTKFVEGWRRAFPKCNIDYVNAGIGATGSDIGAYRLQRDVLDKKPDVVAVEFSVNDSNKRERAESYEGVIRQLLMSERKIAVVLLGMVNQGGYNSQEWHGKVARHYNVPYVSYRDGIFFPYVKEGTVQWRDISPDGIHPNADGHAYAAALVNWTISERYKAYKAAKREPAAIASMPAPLFGTRYDKGRFCKMEDAKILSNNGFFPLRDNCWGMGLACTNAGGRITFEATGASVALLYRCGNKPFNWGKIRVKIDGETVTKSLDCYRDQWWWYTPSLFLCRDKPDRHVIEVETLNDKNEKSAGYGCHLTGVLIGE